MNAGTLREPMIYPSPVSGFNVVADHVLSDIPLLVWSHIYTAVFAFMSPDFAISLKLLISQYKYIHVNTFA